MAKVKISRKLWERIKVSGPCEFLVKPDPARRGKYVAEVEVEEGVEVSRGKEQGRDADETADVR